MNTQISSNLNAQQFLASLNKLSVGTGSAGVIGSSSASSTGSSTSALPSPAAATTASTTAAPAQPQRYALQLNQNLANISNNSAAGNNSNSAASLLRNLQLSPLKSKLGQQQQQSQQQQNMLQQQNSMSGYPLNQSLQNQINFLAAAQQQQQQQKANSIAQANQNTILAAATLLAASANTNTNLCQLSNLYQQQQHQHQAQQQQQQAASQQNSTCSLNNTLFVGNLHASLQEIDLIQVFRPFGRIVECCKKWLHFGFVKFTTEEEALHAYVTLNGFRLKGRPMRLEFQNRTKKARIKAFLAQAALTATSVGMLAGGGATAQDQLLSMGNLGLGGAATNASTQGFASSQNGFGSGSYGAGSGSVNFSFLPNAQNTNNGSFYPAQHHQQQHNQYKSYQSHHHANADSSSSAMLSSLFSADQLLKYATGLEQIEKEAGGMLPPDFNFDLVGCNSEMSLYDELDLKLSIDSSSQQHQHPVYHSSSSSASSFSHFLDVNCQSASLKTASDDLVHSLAKHAISPAESPKHHDTSSSTSVDSGCRSNSFLNDEDSAVYSLSTTATQSCAAFGSHLHVPGGNRHKSLSSSSIGSSGSGGDELNEKRETSKKKVESGDFGCNTISEHLEFTCSKSSPVKSISAEEPMLSLVDKKRMMDAEAAAAGNEEDEDCSSECDTSDDASELPDENLSTTTSDDVDELDDDEDDEENESQHSDDLNDLDLEFELAAVAEELKTAPTPPCLEPLIKYNQVLEEDGSVLRKRLDSGIYKSVNDTASLFIEPHDVLKRMEMNEFDEYSLFPHGCFASDEQFNDNLESLVDDAVALLAVNKF